MSKVLPLLGYKLKSFFSPSYRGRFGPLPLLGMAVAFIPSGLGMGYALGGYLATMGTEAETGFLGTVLSAMLAFGFVFSLGVGITAHPSELDFLMTAPVRPREYLVADMLFQLGSATVAGGMAIVGAVVGLVVGMGKSVWLAVPVFVLLGMFGIMVFLIIQVLTVLRIRHPHARVRMLSLLLLLLSVLPSAAMAASLFPASYRNIPTPQAGFATVTLGLLQGAPVSLQAVVTIAGYFALVAVLWAKVSGEYFFQGVKPTLSAGFGQVDMGTKMAQQKRLIQGFGRFTTRTTIRAEVGSDLSYMTRLNLVRIWRDGSFVFVAILLAVFIGSGMLSSGSSSSSPLTVNIFQAASWPVAIIALNWCYYERANLWIPVVGGRSLVTYFRGLMMSLVVVGIGISAIILIVLEGAGHRFGTGDSAMVLIAPVSDAVVATMLLTRVRASPGAFSPGLLAVLFVTVLVGAVLSYGGLVAVEAVGRLAGTVAAAQLAAAAVIAVLVAYLGLLGVTRLAKGFRFS